MTVHSSKIDRLPTCDEAAQALALLQRWAGAVSAADAAALAPDLARVLAAQTGATYPELTREYPDGFQVSPEYMNSLPDLQNGPSSLIRGAHQPIQHVGISNFRLPVRYRTRGKGDLTLETSVTGTVSLDAEKKGINMSRIMRSFYRHADETFSFDLMRRAIDAYKADLDSFDARIQMRLSFPMRTESLRSGLTGYQYYDLTLELVEQGGVAQQILHLDYVYSSTCPCSLELSEHARRTRGQLATPHSQRSIARISVEILGGACLWFEDVIDMCRAAVPTETQVMVKREDEQAFAELNAANPIFVEDAVRLFCAGLQGDPRIGDFRIVASHQESLHSHDAVSVLAHGPTFASGSLEPRLFSSLYLTG
ncbi:GTP cyclohydrolase FolE2 [Pseudoruegeria sp. SK021]|uniref:GTP cyclohydrolase FolE2 n=1 Tax=Pseudoruegeria sp. SK021 TaxID=1933035 RepID=UPI000A233E89|nr:GTP cyclohydrolase FolE2 [Pseudoruegeria sp. SK021]OSP56681.1 GTP cyclohydrolase [Pseudoruegeria sp. SK021]